MKQHRLLIATDVPFWRKSTGAEQRISSLVRFLTSESIAIRTFYLGQTGTAQFTERDQQLISEGSLDVQQRSSEQPPQALAQKAGWYAAATLHQIQSLTRQNHKDEPEGSPSQSLTLTNFRWPWAIKAFAESFNEFQPDSVLIEYVKLSYLLDALSPKQRTSTQCLIDTHDALHIRCQQFRQYGFSHWIDIDREEESRELSKFDVILAIQSEEAKIFQDMAPATKTIVCGHTTELPATGEATLPQRPEPSKLRLGYLASTNGSNAHAIDSFLNEVWIPLMEDTDHRFELVVGGSICEFVKRKIESLTPAQNLGLRLLGRVDDLPTFYNSVDLVINPVKFGTGLKIKTAESLAFGLPVLTTPAGTAGLTDDFPRNENGQNNCPVIVWDSPITFRRELDLLANSPTRLQECSEAAKKLAQTAFSEQRAYSALKRYLDEPS